MSLIVSVLWPEAQLQRAAEYFLPSSSESDEDDEAGQSNAVPAIHADTQQQKLPTHKRKRQHRSVSPYS